MMWLEPFMVEGWHGMGKGRLLPQAQYRQL